MNPETREYRYRMIASLMVGWPRTPTGKLSRGFWKYAAVEVEHLEGPSMALYPADSLAIWWGQQDRKYQAQRGDLEMPVWIEPKGSRQHKLGCFIVYLREMQERCTYHAAATDDDDTRIGAEARSSVYALVAMQLETLV